MAINSLSDLLAEGVEGWGVLVRSDLNVPLDDNGTITDPGRIIASVPTLKALAEAGAKVVVTAHLGRPKGEPDPKFSLAPVAAALSEQLGRHVQLAGDVVGTDALARAEGLTDGDVLLLENIRFDARETSKDDAERLALAKALAGLVEGADGTPGAFVSDGFGVVHRKQASVYDVATLLPHYAGTLVATEVKVLEQLTSSTERPYAVVLGGSKVSDKLAVIENLATKADSIVIGGGMSYTFAAAQGGKVGNSLCEPEMFPTALEIVKKAEERGVKLVFSPDALIADKFAEDADTRQAPVNDIPDGWMGLDIGEEGKKTFREHILGCKTILWNGPVGVFEMDKFATGSKAVAEAIAEATSKGAFSLIGGGDSVACINKFSLADKVSYVSTGGGALLEYIEGKELPGVAAIRK